MSKFPNTIRIDLKCIVNKAKKTYEVHEYYNGETSPTRYKCHSEQELNRIYKDLKDRWQRMSFEVTTSLPIYQV